MSETHDKPIHLSRYFRLFWNRKGIVLFSAVAVVSAAAIALAFVPRQYVSAATLMIEERKPLSREVEAVMGEVAYPGAAYRVEEARLSQISGRVRSRPFLERVIKVLKMDKDPRVIQEARETKDLPGLPVEEIVIRKLVASLQSRIRVVSLGPGIIRIEISDREPETAQLLARWISELFIDITTGRELEQIRTVRRFGAEQLRIYEEQLKVSEEALERYQGSVIEETLTQGAINEENILAADAAHLRCLDDASSARARVGPLARAASQAGFAGDHSLILNDSEFRRMVASLVGAKERVILLEIAGATADAAARAAAEASVTSLRRDLIRSIDARVPEIYASVSPDARRAVTAYALAWFDAETQDRAAGRLKNMIDAFRSRAIRNPGREMDLTRLKDEVANNRRLLESFRAQTVASDVSQAVETTNLGLKIEILDPADLPFKPSSPHAAKTLLMASILGVLLGLCAAYVSEIADPTLKTLEDIARSIPEAVLGTLPLIDAIPVRTGRKRSRWVPIGIASLLILTVAVYGLKERLFPDWTFGERRIAAVDPNREAKP